MFNLGTFCARQVEAELIITSPFFVNLAPQKPPKTLLYLQISQNRVVILPNDIAILCATEKH